jgi:hypothetical protein
MGLFFELVLVLELQGVTLDESGGVNEESRRKLEEVRFGYYFSVAYSKYFITCNRVLAPTASF